VIQIAKQLRVAAALGLVAGVLMSIIAVANPVGRPERAAGEVLRR
jgi:hypothetical protein